VTIDELPDHLRPTWDIYCAEADEEISLTADEWWAAITWQAADKARYCWVYVQRTHYVEYKEYSIPADLQ
jgi:hypothetical protein